MSVINFGGGVSLSEFATAIETVGQSVTIIGEGEMGIGKSSVLKTIAARRPDLVPAYIDCTLIADVGDFALPYTVEENGIKVTRFAPNARFRFQEGKPVLIMLDEIGKATKPVKNALLTLMLERRIGDHYLPEGSIVFGTTNLLGEGVGDLLERHARNRVCVVRISKPDADTWIEWALDNAVAPEVIAWVKQYPHCLASFDDPSQRDNPYINHPTKTGQGAVVTPRSLERASFIVKQRGVLGDNVVIALLAGVIGESAARDMQAFLTVADKLPTWEALVASPNTAKLPDDTVARCIMVYSAIARVTKDTLAEWMTYMERMEREWQALFAKAVMKSNKQAFCVSNKQFRDWAVKNEWLF